LKLPRLKEVRELHGWSQTKLAEEADVSRDSISNYETGHREAYPATAKRLADALDVEIADLIEPTRELAHPLAEAPRGAGLARHEQQWESALANVRARRSEVQAKVEELVESPGDEVDPYQVKWALDEAKECEFALMLALPGSSRRGRNEITINLSAFDLEQWEEVLNARRFYDSIVERLVEASLVRFEGGTGQKAEPVPVGIGS
jgi:transcriptional regulator with XRE-family HTH domain